MQAKNIDEVISILEGIIEETKQSQNTMGYFAALYQKVTCKVKEGIEQGIFEDNERMERLDVIFANRYLKAYSLFSQNKTPDQSWSAAFVVHDDYWLIVLQHLLLGMNAHINLDLGIAAAEISKGQPIENLKNDFDKINEILASLVKEVENELSTIWPTLKKVLKWTKKLDTFLINFSMELARDGAWKFAVLLSETQEDNWKNTINDRDLSVTKKASIVTKPGWIVSLIFKIIRIGEKGSIQDKISILEQK